MDINNSNDIFKIFSCWADKQQWIGDNDKNISKPCEIYEIHYSQSYYVDDQTEYDENEETQKSSFDKEDEELKSEEEQKNLIIYNHKTNDKITFITSKFTIFTEPKNEIEFLRKKKCDKITRRKEKADDIKKKIISRFHKILKNIINENLEKAGSQKIFVNLPQCFVSDVTKKNNKNIFDKKYKEILETDFSKEMKDKKEIEKNYKKNKKVIEYLEKNPEISQNSGFNVLCRLSYEEILKEYFKSQEFYDVIQKVREKEGNNYYEKYIYQCYNYISSFYNGK
jgi:hypothetical protein